MGNLLASLAVAGIVERTGRQRQLRVTPRFLAHAERTAAGLRLSATPALEQTLRTALRDWDEYRHDPSLGAVLLTHLLDDQWGTLQPVFPPIEAFALA